MTRELHLGLNVLAAGSHPASWQWGESDPLGWVKIEQWKKVATLAEKGALDAIFLPDLTNINITESDYLDGPPLSLDPIVLVSTLAAATAHIGLVPTVSTTFEEPYNLARRISSLDHLSQGRAAWNIVTSVDGSAIVNFGGRAYPPREERYARAEEFVEVVRALWDSWDDGAVVAQKPTSTFTQRGAIRPIYHEGKHFSVKGPLNVPRSPQGRPVLVQAGASGPGLNLAARHADAVFSAAATLEDAQAYAADLRQRAASFGRAPDSIRILPGLGYVLGGTEGEAQARYRELNALAGDRRLAWFAWQLGVKTDEIAWDKPLPDWLLNDERPTTGSQGARDIVLRVARRERLTVRQLLDRISNWHRLVIGTPEQLAETIAEWFLSGAVDGFNLMSDIEPSGTEAFVDHVVPLLRRRGIFRSGYRGATLRDHLGLERPANRFPAAWAS